jgi:hypothetical protein
MMDGVRRWGGLPRRLVRELAALDGPPSIHSPSNDEDRQPYGTINGF